MFLGASDEANPDHHHHLESYATKIQHSLAHRPHRVSFAWRFTSEIIPDPEVLLVLESMQCLTGWNTISFQIAIYRHLGNAMLKSASEIFLKCSDNYYIRIDEIQSGYDLFITPHQSTLATKGNMLEAVERHVHEDVYANSSVAQARSRVTGGWVTRTVRV